MTQDRLRQLIAQYLLATTNAVASLRRDYPYTDILSTRREGRIPKNGITSGGWKFKFHGVGCSFESAECEIELDFGPNGRCDGFDAWRLAQFAVECGLAAEYPEEAITAGLHDLEVSGDIIRPALPPSPHLFYLCSSPMPCPGPEDGKGDSDFVR